MENLKLTKKIILTFLSKMRSITLIPLEEIVTKLLASIQILKMFFPELTAFLGKETDIV